MGRSIRRRPPTRRAPTRAAARRRRRPRSDPKACSAASSAPVARRRVVWRVYGRALTSVDDAALIARARGGSTKAFESLVERHQRRIYGLALRVLRDHDQADEATQRSFVHAWEHLGGFRGESSFATWLHHIAMNECRDILRAERRKVALDDVPEARL